MNIGGPKRFTQFKGLGELGFGGSSAYKIVPGYLPQGAAVDPMALFNELKAKADAAKTSRVAALKEKLANMSTMQKAMMYVGGVAGAYHGYKRNDSIFWAIMWSIAGSVMPIIAGPVMFAQGFGKRKNA